MSFLVPDAGLLFWMLLAFGIVFFILYKYGFPVILSMIEERKNYIDASLKKAKEVEKKYAAAEHKSNLIIENAHEEEARILREAATMRNQIIKEAHAVAESERERLLNETRRLIQQEKETAMREIRSIVAELSIGVAEKILRDELSDGKKQLEYAERLLGSIEDGKEGKS